MTEHEIKVMLTEDEYLALASTAGKFSTSTIQTNYYFDTEKMSMSNKGITCRIRHKNGTYKATMKFHNSKEIGCSEEKDICETSSFDPTVFNVLGLRYQGNLVTERTEIYKDGYCQAVIDRNTYLGKTDFELEIEYSEMFKGNAYVRLNSIAQLLCELECIPNKETLISRVLSAKSKSQRFFEEKVRK